MCLHGQYGYTKYHVYIFSSPLEKIIIANTYITFTLCLVLF